MTEEEAKTKRCCGPEGCGEYVRPIAYLSEPGGPVVQLPGQPRICIGSACMAWRHDTTTVNPFDEVRAWQRPAGDDWYLAQEHTMDILPLWRRSKPAEQLMPHGYCGLAAQP